jgi:hypothetical protein
MISEHEGVNAVARDSLGQDNTMLSCPLPSSLLLFLALAGFVFLSGCSPASVMKLVEAVVGN